MHRSDGSAQNKMKENVIMCTPAACGCFFPVAAAPLVRAAVLGHVCFVMFMLLVLAEKVNLDRNCVRVW